MDNAKAGQVLEILEGLQTDHDISIIRLSEPISSAFSQDPRQRTSDASNSSLDAPTPASLEADLTHYKELFAKLRFSYVEQVTKEKFIRAIVGDPPLIVSPQENSHLEKENAAAKARLKELKLEVADMVAELERQGRQLSQEYEKIQLETAQLKELPDKMDRLEEQIAKLKNAQSPGQGPDLNLPLTRTLELVEDRKNQEMELDRLLEQLQAHIPRKRKEIDRLQAELQPLETRRQNSTAAAKEARRRKEAALGGVEDDLEERGRWWRASEAVLKQMLGIQS